MLYTYYYWSEEYQSVVKSVLVANNSNQALHIIQDKFDNKNICFAFPGSLNKVSESDIVRIAENKTEMLLVDPDGKPCLLKTN